MQQNRCLRRCLLLREEAFGNGLKLNSTYRLRLWVKKKILDFMFRAIETTWNL